VFYSTAGDGRRLCRRTLKKRRTNQCFYRQQSGRKTQTGSLYDRKGGPSGEKKEEQYRTIFMPVWKGKKGADSTKRGWLGGCNFRGGEKIGRDLLYEKIGGKKRDCTFRESAGGGGRFLSPCSFFGPHLGKRELPTRLSGKGGEFSSLGNAKVAIRKKRRKGALKEPSRRTKEKTRHPRFFRNGKCKRGRKSLHEKGACSQEKKRWWDGKRSPVSVPEGSNRWCNMRERR